MTIKIVGGNQVICDCAGNTPETYQERLLVGIAISHEKSVAVETHCPQCNSSGLYEIKAKLVMKFNESSESICNNLSTMKNDSRRVREPF